MIHVFRSRCSRIGQVGGRRRLAPWAPPQAEIPVAGRASGGKGRWAPKGKEGMVGVSIEGRKGGPKAGQGESEKEK